MKATYEMAQRLVDEGLVKASTCGDFTIYKYAKKVFFKNLWTPELELFRGTVFRGTELVVEPLLKVYNYGERGTGHDIPLDTQVVVDYKVNGFMLNVTLVDGRLLFSTTGSLDSEFVALGMEMFFDSLTFVQIDELFEFPDLTTFTFEAVHPEDPHIVEEVYGLHLLRIKTPEKVYSLEERNAFARKTGLLFHVPLTVDLEGLLERSKYESHEGWMVYSSSEELLFKLKTSHYLTKKAIMRSNRASDLIFGPNPKEHFDEEFYGLIDYLRASVTKECWETHSDQERRKVIEDFFKNKGAF